MLCVTARLHSTPTILRIIVNLGLATKQNDRGEIIHIFLFRYRFFYLFFLYGRLQQNEFT